MTRPDDLWTDPGTGQPLAVPRRESTEPTGYRYEELWQASARVAGWVPLADVLDALRDGEALMAWFVARHPYACIDMGGARFFGEYLAERFAPTAPEGADERNGHG